MTNHQDEHPELLPKQFITITVAYGIVLSLCLKAMVVSSLFLVGRLILSVSRKLVGWDRFSAPFPVVLVD